MGVSVSTILSRFDAPVDTVSPSAEDVAISGSESTNFVEMLNYLGGAWVALDSGFEIVLNRTAQRHLPAWPHRRFYPSWQHLPDAFLRDVYAAHQDAVAAWEAKQARCRFCGTGHATEPFAHQERQACRPCLDRHPSLMSLVRHEVMPCRRCGASVFDQDTEQQIVDFGKRLGICDPCYRSAGRRGTVTITADGTVSW
jgi:hypothetical protein